MPRNLSPATAAASLLRNTSPLYLFEMVLPSQTLRVCTYDGLTWNSLTWLGSKLEINQLSGEGASVGLFDYDAAFRTLFLLDGVQDRAVKVWVAFYTALGATDPVLVFSGVSTSFTWRGGKIVLGLRRQSEVSTLSPRKRMTPDTGFNFLAPKGTEIRWGDRIIKLE